MTFPLIARFFEVRELRDRNVQLTRQLETMGSRFQTSQRHLERHAAANKALIHDLNIAQAEAEAARATAVAHLVTEEKLRLLVGVGMVWLDNYHREFIAGCDPKVCSVAAWIEEARKAVTIDKEKGKP